MSTGKSATRSREVSTLYATYAYDPKTASDEPRVIMQDADLIKISISDSGRDKRTGVLIRGASKNRNRHGQRRRFGVRISDSLVDGDVLTESESAKTSFV